MKKIKETDVNKSTNQVTYFIKMYLSYTFILFYFYFLEQA